MQLTLAGRMFIGSWWRMGQFLRARSAVHSCVTIISARKAGSIHFALCVPVVYWVTVVCGIPFWLYVVAMVVPGNAILLIRSFAEHRAFAGMRERTALIENSWVLGPLFLFNNLHSLHHAEPLLPWYRYNARYEVDARTADRGERRPRLLDVFRRRTPFPVAAARPAATSHRARAGAPRGLRTQRLRKSRPCKGRR